ncbi:hypothetical protein VNO77_19192 [Canavalia gladiata]|uniref:Uncharacterized protein n=1 Tax=Canavalia gladiata TaxID=3824 RepID=A0AAN9LLZ5_CANGL
MSARWWGLTLNPKRFLAYDSSSSGRPSQSVHILCLPLHDGAACILFMHVQGVIFSLRGPVTHYHPPPLVDLSLVVDHFTWVGRFSGLRSILGVLYDGRWHIQELHRWLRLSVTPLARVVQCRDPEPAFASRPVLQFLGSLWPRVLSYDQSVLECQANGSVHQRQPSRHDNLLTHGRAECRSTHDSTICSGAQVLFPHSAWEGNSTHDSTIWLRVLWTVIFLWPQQRCSELASGRRHSRHGRLRLSWRRCSSFSGSVKKRLRKIHSAISTLSFELAQGRDPISSSRCPGIRSDIGVCVIESRLIVVCEYLLPPMC